VYELRSERLLKFLKWLYDQGNLEPPARHTERSSLTAEEVDLLINPEGKDPPKELAQG
jgi:hypothetical protein